MIRVLIVDDHALVRRGIAELLDEFDDLEVVGAAADAAEGLRVATAEHPDVVLLDISMPGMGGVEAAARLREASPASAVVMLTSSADQENVIASLDSGATGYLLKDAEPEEIVRGIRAAARGESPLSPRAATAVLEARTRPRPAEALSEREREVLELVGSGLTNKQIAYRLRISEKTVKAHLTRVFRELGVGDRTQAALWAQRHGMGEVPDA
jgi:DNA-binding NarL/FixJ family response regulator